MKHTRLRLILVPVLALAVWMASSCNTTGCTENQNSVPLAGFYSYETGEAISVDSLAIFGAGAPNDSLLNPLSQHSSSVYLPFRSTDEYCTFYIKYMQKSLAQYDLQDQVTFYYESHPWFASEECGAMYHYRITRVAYTNQILDSVGVTDSLITNIERENIQLFFRTGSSDPDASDTSVTNPTEGESND